jgi:hypothetical protein
MDIPVYELIIGIAAKNLRQSQNVSKYNQLKMLKFRYKMTDIILWTGG